VFYGCAVCLWRAASSERSQQTVWSLKKVEKFMNEIRNLGLQSRGQK
jgi:hypothetical protein